MGTSKKGQKTAKEVKKGSVDLSAAKYGSVYDNLDKAVVSLNEDLSKVVTASKKILSKSNSEIDSLHKKNDADVISADKALADEESKVAEAINLAKSTLAKQAADIKTAEDKAKTASNKRITDAKNAELKAKNAAEKSRKERETAANRANAEIAKQNAQEVKNEEKRNLEVVKNRNELNENNAEAYANTCAKLKAEYDKDVAALNASIDAAQKKYFDTVNAKTQAYNKSCADKKAKCDASIAEYTKQSKSSDKATMKAGLKGISTTQKAYDSDAKKCKAEFDADLADLKAKFVASVPPIEHNIYLRANRYRIECLDAENANLKAIDKSAYEELIEIETNTLNNQTCTAENEIKTEEQKHVEFCDAEDNKLAIALADFATETFNAEEEYRLTELNYKISLDNKKALVKQYKALEDAEHRRILAIINNKYAKLNGESDTKYNHLVSELDSLITSFKGYYTALNKFNGTSIDTLSAIASSFKSGCNDLGMDDGKAGELFDQIAGVYNDDCKHQETGVLDGKIEELNLCETNALDFAKKRYEYEKSVIKDNYDNEVRLENARHDAKIAELDNDLEAFTQQTNNNINTAKATLEKTVGEINARIANYRNNDGKARAESENNKNASIKSKNANLKRLGDEKKARENAKLAKIKQHAAELDSKLETLKTSINLEKKGENAQHEKLTQKTIKVLLKNCDIKPDKRWWVVDFSKK